LRRFASVATLFLAIAALLALTAGSARAVPLTEGLFSDEEDAAMVSGAYDFRDQSGSTNVTECPQAGLRDKNPAPLERRTKDDTERKGEAGGDVRANQDYSCFPQDETSLDQNPTNSKNYVGGANDYRLGWGTSGFYATTDNGNHWYDGIIPFPSLPSGDNLDGGGDPAIVYDRAGIVYYADINFNRTDDTNGVWVSRSTNGGFTWTRPCSAIDTTADPTDDAAVCGGPGDVRQPGDGTVTFCETGSLGETGTPPQSIECPGFDKEWITAGPRPSGVNPTCFTPLQHTPTTCNADVIGTDRLYVTFSVFSDNGSAQIFLSYSDDQARSWSDPKLINGGANFCAAGGRPGNGCDDSQGSQPTVNPATGTLWVGFINGDTTDEDQYLVVRSNDGGNTFTGPFRVDTLYDVNEPRGVNGRADCVARGQGSTRAVPTNSCFRFDPIMNSIVADKRGGQFADDLYVVLVDNRNGTIRNSNNDAFFYKSTDGGVTWIGPTRVNDDRSASPANRDCGRRPNSIRSTTPTSVPPGNGAADCPAEGNGNDQFFPWITIDNKGNLNVSFHDRRLDTDSPVGVGAWPTSKTEKGNYLVWYWGAQCTITQTSTVSQATTGPVPAAARQCVAPEAIVNPTVATGFNPGAGPVPGNGQNSNTLPFRNFQISDVGTNFDYSFRAGIFAGDYSGNSSGPIVTGDTKGDEDGQAAALWTDARNGRGSGDPTSTQPGRNPICEQSDVFFDRYSVRGGGKKHDDEKGDKADQSFLIAPCPAGIKDKRGDRH
jgi:hypothetical protein